MSPDLQLFLSTASVSQKEEERYVSDAVVLQDRAKSMRECGDQTFLGIRLVSLLLPCEKDIDQSQITF
jgi:type II secretory pathway component PulL